MNKLKQWRKFQRRFWKPKRTLPPRPDVVQKTRRIRVIPKERLEQSRQK